MVALISVPATHADTFGNGANTFEIEFVSIGSPNNPDDTTGTPSPAGKVEYAYRMGKYEISQEMIGKATDSGMTNVTAGAWSGTQPAANVSWYEAAAFVNWLNTSEGHQAAYDLTWTGSSWSMGLWSSADAWQKGGENLFRHKDAYYFLPMPTNGTRRPITTPMQASTTITRRVAIASPTGSTLRAIRHSTRCSLMAG